MEFGAPTALALVHRSVTGQDGDGNDIPGFTAVLAWGAFAPGGTSENIAGQDRVISQPTVYLDDVSVSLAAVDAVVVAPDVVDGALVLDGSGYPVGGTSYEVDGDPGTWVSPFDGWAPGIAVPLHKVAG